jgi:hypothetical protein
MIEGGCLCGSVRYKATQKPLQMRACWCRLCQFIASGSATINLAFRTEAVTITGELKDFPSTAESGSKMHRRFCPTCGTHLFSEAEERPHLIIIRAGTLDDPGLVELDTVIWTAEAPRWAYIDPNIPHFKGQPPPIG